MISKKRKIPTLNTSQIPWETVTSIIQGTHYLMNQMIAVANARPGASKTDPKVGGHSSASSSAVHILGALHLIVRRGFDFMANKPHASPVDHSYNYLLNLFLDKNGEPLKKDEAEKAMHGLRAFPTKDHPYVFQSYHSHHDPDHHNFLPSGTVGIPPVVLAYLGVAYQLARHHHQETPPAHFWALIGDSEFREGSLFEAIPDLAERQMGAVTWVIDYNRQSLDGHRSTHPSMKTDDRRIENTFLSNGWEVIQVRHGQIRKNLFKQEGGLLFQDFFEKNLSDIDLQILLQIKEASLARKFIIKKSKDLKNFLNSIDDQILMQAISDLGGHDIQEITSALINSKKNPLQPCCVVAHTIKGWGLKMAAQSGNHSAIPSAEELSKLRSQTQLKKDEVLFPTFDPSSPESLFLKERGQSLLQEIKEQKQLKLKNENKFKFNSKLPKEMGLSLKLISSPHTQWMMGQWISRLARIRSSSLKKLKENEKPFYEISKMLISLSPDVGTSTNLSFSMDHKVFNSSSWENSEEEWGIQSPQSPNLKPGTSDHHHFLRFEIAEAASLSCLAAFGKMRQIIGIPFFPIMSVYDFFVKRALDQYFYALYMGSEFILAGTPSGITLSPEGAQHGWKSDFQIPNQITWEPYFCKEMDWILTDSLRRHLDQDHHERKGVLVRAVTRGVDQKKFLHHLKKQFRFKKTKQNLPLHIMNDPLSSSINEAQVESYNEDQILEVIRKQVLQGAYPLVLYQDYKDYKVEENVAHIFSMGALTTEALEASEELLKRGIYANVIVVTSPDLLLGGLAHQEDYRYLRQDLNLNFKAALVSVHDGEPGLLDNIGSIVGRPQETLAVRKHSMCGRPTDVNTYHGLDSSSIVHACLRALNSS